MGLLIVTLSHDARQEPSDGEGVDEWLARQ